MKKYFFPIVLIIYLLHIFWSQRAIFTETFDAPYWMERYETSQWSLPLSERVIGDDGLYLVEGYLLTGGADPSKHNAEVPPLGKYLIGLSIRLFSNGNIYGFITTLLLVAAVWFLAKRVTGHRYMAWAASLLFATDPLMTSQFSLTMLDTLQSLFLVLHMIGLYVFMRSSRFLTWSIICGIFLGLFAGAKAPLFVPVIMITGVVAIWIKSRRLTLVFIYIFSSFATYLLTHLPYFFYQHSFMDWLRLQKWLISFYLSSKVDPNIGSIFTTLLANQTKDLFSDSWHSSAEWTLMWPIITIVSLFSYRLLKNKLLFSTLLLLICMFVVRPFWVRYLILVLPLLYVTSVAYIATRFSQKQALVLVSIGVLFNIFFSMPLLYPTAEKEFQQFTADWEHGYFHDMSERFTSDSKMKFERTALQEEGLTYLYDAQIEAIDVRYDPRQLRHRFGQLTVPVEIAYRTRHLGEFVEHSSVKLIHERNKWRILWDWESFMKGIVPGVRIQTLVDQATRGTLTKSGVAATDFESELVSIIPGDVDPEKEQEMLEYLSQLFENKLFPLSIHQRYIANTLPQRPRAIGVFPKQLEVEDRTRLLTYKGISLTPAYGRTNLIVSTPDIDKVTNTLFIECCSLLYSTTAYDGGAGLEKEFNSVLKGYNGGSIVMYDSSGKLIRTLVTREKRNGLDVEL